MLQIEVGPHIAKYVIDQVHGGIDLGDCVGIGTSRDGVICGGVVFYEYNGTNIWMHAASHTTRWLNKEYLHYIFDYAFNTAGCKRISAFIDASNEHALKFDKKIGFKIECTLKDACSNGDVHILCLKKEDCKWVIP